MGQYQRKSGRKMGYRSNLLSDKAEERITIGFKGSRTLHAQVREVADHYDTSVNDLLCKIVQAAISHRRTKMRKAENVRDRLLREIQAQD